MQAQNGLGPGPDPGRDDRHSGIVELDSLAIPEFGLVAGEGIHRTQNNAFLARRLQKSCSMRMKIVFCFGVLFFTLIPGARGWADSNHSIPPWSSAAHLKLIQDAFPKERADCLEKMREGSEWVDSLPNQVPSRSHMHAMRGSESESPAEAGRKMADFIQSQYELALDGMEASTSRSPSSPADSWEEPTGDGRWVTDPAGFLEACTHRGMALHPVMDSTSAAHEGFAIWSITDLQGLFRHGDLPGSVENLQALLNHPDDLVKTIGLMRQVDFLVLGLKIRDFRFEP